MHPGGFCFILGGRAYCCDGEGVIHILYVHPDLQKRVEDRRRQEAMRVAETWRLLRQARAQRPARLSRPGCWLLCQLGHLLVRWGRRLQEVGSPQPVPKAG
jgi:hypothetical protein